MTRSVLFILCITLALPFCIEREANANTKTFLEVRHEKKSGNTEQDSFGAKAGKKFSDDGFEYFVSGYFDYETSNEQRSSNKGGGFASVDFNLAKKHGVFAFQIGKFDEFRKIKFRSESALGYKYSIFLPKGKLSLSGAVLYEHTEFLPPGVSNSMRASFRLKFAQKVFKESQFQHITFYQPRLTYSPDFLLTTETFLAVPMNSFLKIKISVESEYDNNPQPGVWKKDTSINTSLAINF